jgi:hypothetical protein
MSPRDRLTEVGAWLFDHIRGLVNGILSVLTVVVDWFYDRLDLWQNRGARIADHGKVRSAILYLGVLGIMVYLVAWAPKPPSTATLVNVLLALIALSAGERTLLAFFKMLSLRKDLREHPAFRHQAPEPPAEPPSAERPTIL